MNALVRIHPFLRLALPVLFSFALLRPVHAAETVIMIWTDVASSDSYEVSAPDDRLLSEVKQEVMTQLGLSVLKSPLYAVEKLVVTTTAVRGQFDPVTGLPVVTTTEEYVMLSEDTSLFDLEIASGDKLRLIQVQEDTADEEVVDTANDVAQTKSCNQRGHKGHFHHGNGKNHKHGRSRKFRFG